MASLNNPQPTPPSSAAKRVSSDGVNRAVKALLKWRKDQPQPENPKLLEEDEFIYLVIALKKIPPKDRTDPYKIALPHPLQTADSTELCLIIDDRPKSNLNKDGAEKKIKAENIPVAKVIKVTELRSDYKPFDAKRKLFDSYDMFFADKRIVPLLPKLLGKVFFKKKKIPVPVDLKHGNWKEQIENVLGSAMLYLKTGTCSVLRVARTSMGREEIVENVLAAISGVAEIVPRKWYNVRSFHVKLLESLALPVYQADSGAPSRIEVLKSKEEEKNDKAERKPLKKSRIQKDSSVGDTIGEDDSLVKEKKRSRIGKLNNVEMKIDKKKNGIR